jgi:aspartate racemase
MKTTRCVGLVGGLGVGAAIYYYEQLAKAHAERGRRMDFVMVHAETDRIFEYAKAGDRDGMAEYLCGFLRRLKAAGAEFGVIPAVTPHFCVRELAVISPLPLFDMFRAVNAEIARRRLLRVAVFGTRYPMEAKLFGLLDGVEVVACRPDEVDYVHEAYVGLLAPRPELDERRKGLTDLARRLIERDGVDAIVLAGTDFVKLFDEGNTEFPSVDCAALHLRAIADGLLVE